MKRRRRRDILRVQLVRIFELLADAGVISHRLVLDFDFLNFFKTRDRNIFFSEEIQKSTFATTENLYHYKHYLPKMHLVH